MTRLDDLTDTDLAAWRALASRAAEPNPFFEPEFLLPAAAALAPGAISLAVVEDEGGRWTGAAAVRRSRSWRRLPVPCLELWTHEYSGLEVPLIDRAAIVPTVAALVDMLRGRRGSPLVSMPQIPADGAYAAALGEVLGGAAQPVVVNRWERAALRRRPEQTYAAEAMSGKRRSELGRLRRGIAKEHEVTTTDLGGDPAGVESFLALEESGWKGREGTALASDPVHARFFREMCSGFAADGRLQMIALTVDGAPIAMRCNLRSGDRVFGFKMAFDEEWSRWSPGRLADMDAIGHFHDATDASLMDSIAHPGNDYMNGMWPDRLSLCTMVVPGRGAVGWAAGRAAAASSGVRAARERRSASVPAPEPAVAGASTSTRGAPNTAPSGGAKKRPADSLDAHIRRQGGASHRRADVGLTTRITPLEDLTDQDLAAWRALAERAVEPNPFFEPEFLVPAAAALAPGAISLAVVEDEDGRWTGAAAVRRSRRWRKLRVPCLELWTHMYSGLEVPLIDASAIGPTVTELVGALRRRRGTSIVAMTQIPVDGPYASALSEALGGGARILVVDRYERAALRRRPEPTYIVEAMSKKRRHEVERLRRGLEKEHTVTTDDLAGDAEAVERFLAIEESGWKGREGTALASDPAHAHFFREMCAGYAAAGRLEMIALSVDGEPIAMKCNLRSGDRIFTFKMAFDEDWSRWSPGRLVDMAGIAHFHDSTDAMLMDSIAHPENEYMNGIWPDRLRLCTMLVPSEGALGWAAGRAVATTLSIRSARARTPVPGPAVATALALAASI